MFDGFWAGIFGGLFGPALATWLSGYRYWVIFVSTTLGVHVSVFVLVMYKEGWNQAIKVLVEQTFTPEGILVPMAIGLFAVVVAVMGTLNAPKREDKSQ